MSQSVRDVLGSGGTEADRKRRWPFFVILAILLVIPAYILVKSSEGTAPVSTSNPAKAQLQSALAAANQYYAKDNTYRGFTPKVANAIDPSLIWNDGNTTLTEISIRAATASHVLLVSADAGGTFCILGDSKGGATYGSVDAQSAKDCQDASW